MAEISPPARITGAVMAAVPANADALSRRPAGHTVADIVDDADDFVAGHPGILNPGRQPVFRKASLWQTPQAWTLMRTCPAPGFGTSRSTIWKSAPGAGICAAFIVAISTCVVAMVPPELLSRRGDVERRCRR
jgi:hypothetical protein